MTATMSTQLFVRSDIDEKDMFEQDLLTQYSELLLIIGGKESSHEIGGILHDRVSRDAAGHNRVMTGLICGILVDPKKAGAYFQHILIVGRDACDIVIKIMERMLRKYYSRCIYTVKQQTLWLLGEMIAKNVNNTHILLMAALRRIEGGNLGKENIWVADRLLRLLTDNVKWFYASKSLIPFACYTFARLSLDHSKVQSLQDLFVRESRFVQRTFENRFDQCKTIGRDFLRVLSELKGTAAYQELWNKIHTNPTSIHPSFHGAEDILVMRTPRIYLTSRLTTDMETQLFYIMNNVKMGNQTRYQTWFHKKWLDTPESDTLISDIVRYIVCVFHPSNALLQSNMVTRWAMIGWLLKSVKSNQSLNSIRMAALFDWFLFVEGESVMNLEPAALLILNSVQQYTDITVSLLEYLLNGVDEFKPVQSNPNFVRDSAFRALKSLKNNRVIQDFAYFVNHAKIPPRTRFGLRQAFPQIFPKENVESGKASKPSPQAERTDDTRVRFNGETLDIVSKGGKKVLNIVNVADVPKPKSILKKPSDDKIVKKSESNVQEPHESEKLGGGIPFANDGYGAGGGAESVQRGAAAPHKEPMAAADLKNLLEVAPNYEQYSGEAQDSLVALAGKDKGWELTDEEFGERFKSFYASAVEPSGSSDGPAVPVATLVTTLLAIFKSKLQIPPAALGYVKVITGEMRDSKEPLRPLFDAYVRSLQKGYRDGFEKDGTIVPDATNLIAASSLFLGFRDKEPSAGLRFLIYCMNEGIIEYYPMYLADFKKRADGIQNDISTGEKDALTGDLEFLQENKSEHVVYLVLRILKGKELSSVFFSCANCYKVLFESLGSEEISTLAVGAIAKYSMMFPTDMQRLGAIVESSMTWDTLSQLLMWRFFFIENSGNAILLGMILKLFVEKWNKKGQEKEFRFSLSCFFSHLASEACFSGSLLEIILLVPENFDYLTVPLLSGYLASSGHYNAFFDAFKAISGKPVNDYLLCLRKLQQVLSGSAQLDFFLANMKKMLNEPNSVHESLRGSFEELLAGLEVSKRKREVEDLPPSKRRKKLTEIE